MIRFDVTRTVESPCQRFTRPMLFQEQLVGQVTEGQYPWAMATGCIMLNLTQRSVGFLDMERILGTYPSPLGMANLDPGFVVDKIAGGLQMIKACRLKAMATDCCNQLPFIEWTGVGTYAWESYSIFVVGKIWEPKEITDTHLREYMEWKVNS